MAAPVVTPVLQWLDPQGTPYAGGTITTYISGTGTPKQTWTDPALTAANPNPVPLDGAGRSIMWGDGDYRLVLHDAGGNLIFDQPATTIVSAAMAPVVSAPTIADAWHQLGGADAIAGETAARVAGDNALSNAITTGDNALSADLATLATDVSIVSSDLGSEITRATAAEANLQAQIDGGMIIQAGSNTTDTGGHRRVTFPTPFSAAPASVVATPTGLAGQSIPLVVGPADANGVDVYTDPSFDVPFNWIAVGA